MHASCPKCAQGRHQPIPRRDWLGLKINDLHIHVAEPALRIDLTTQPIDLRYKMRRFRVPAPWLWPVRAD